MADMSYVSSYYHCVFSTKARLPLIIPPLQERLWPYLGGVARQNRIKAIASAVPTGLWLLGGLDPTLKRWAILGCYVELHITAVM
jgi:hypothetical protein